MLGIRSITYQLPESYSDAELSVISKASRIWDNNYEFIRTQRVSLCPQDRSDDFSKFNKISRLCDETRIRWFNVPIDPYVFSEKDELFKFGYNILHRFPRAFVNILCVKNNRFEVDNVIRCFNLIRKVSRLSIDGKDNFRLGLSVNVNEDCPFFPFSISNGTLGFSIALEITQVMNIFLYASDDTSFNKIQKAFIEFIDPQIDKINNLAEKIADETGLVFKGFDFSLAPIIDPNGSIVSILNFLGVYNFGKAGNMFATSFITNILKNLACKYKSVGFSGVMYSVLEDLELCSINNERGVTVEQLITQATMCGCGIDMIPVYGNITNDELMSMFLDVVAISSRLHKPLGMRVLPIPDCGKNQRVFTNFQDDSDFIANTRTIPLDLNILTKISGQFEYLSTAQ